MSDNQVIVITGQQLKEFAREIADLILSARDTEQPSRKPTAKRYVYGLRGIRDLFNVSHVTAQKYKDTILAPAVMQRGRKIVVDVDEALRLYKLSANA